LTRRERNYIANIVDSETDESPFEKKTINLEKGETTIYFSPFIGGVLAEFIAHRDQILGKYYMHLDCHNGREADFMRCISKCDEQESCKTSFFRSIKKKYCKNNQDFYREWFNSVEFEISMLSGDATDLSANAEYQKSKNIVNDPKTKAGMRAKHEAIITKLQAALSGNLKVKDDRMRLLLAFHNDLADHMEFILNEHFAWYRMRLSHYWKLSRVRHAQLPVVMPSDIEFLATVNETLLGLERKEQERNEGE
jgi:hypothetical protein